MTVKEFRNIKGLMERKKAIVELANGKTTIVKFICLTETGKNILKTLDKSE